MSRMRMREEYLKRFRIDARLDDARAKMEDIKVVCEGEALKVSAALTRRAAYFQLANTTR